MPPPRGPLPKNLLHYPSYWEKDPSLWDVFDWDMFFISKFPYGNLRQSHSTLSSELEMLIKNLPKGCRCRKASSILKRIKVCFSHFFEVSSK
ncbi:hypothetical protein BC937DRAFT_89501 [Endogone sp. FLAS-F59071]|nr:hypothetical protein BC937DRAFT_89501 [Endogone sp. FLAS-F59071]|eukprot:RUS17781.1 hypothetical protein BC937DRAFT_89501 [Endogone sp. FLAS-F59071]